jgi:hypothetical protein
MSTAEKRKWSEVSSGCEHHSGCGPERAGSSGACSCDDEDRAAEEAFLGGEFAAVSGGTPPTPVQFRASPPVDVHKPHQVWIS